MTKAIDSGASVVITHRVQGNKTALYEEWAGQISAAAKKSSGLLDWQMIRPVPNLTSTFTVLLRFSSLEELKNWMNSEERKRYIELVRPFLENDEDYYFGSGLDFLFAQGTAKSLMPKRWKQALITFLAIYPLTLIIPRIVLPILDSLEIRSQWIGGLSVTAFIVYLMVYVVMPHFTRIAHRWLTQTEEQL